MDAAEAADASTDEEFLGFVASAVSDERRQELLARALIIAQDTALRDKRRAGPGACVRCGRQRHAGR